MEKEPTRINTNIPRILITISRQSLELVHNGSVLWSAKISSGKAGVGFRSNSGETPIGHFRIYQKIGEGSPINTIFKARQPVGLYDFSMSHSTQYDFILTRILWLDGLDPQNRNTKNRYIYIHGTNDVKHLGTPNSAGCIRLAPDDMLYLFNVVTTATPVVITTD